MPNKRYPSVRGLSQSQQIRMVREIFSTVTSKYDVLNHLLSLRRDVAWRRFCVKRMSFFKTNRLLDVATGTGDLAIAAARRHPQVHVTGLDFVREMLDQGERKIRKRQLSGRITFLNGDALHLPFPDDSFDTIAIAFGIRNIPEKTRALREMLRVVTPGGQVMVLEFNFPRTPLFRPVYYVYLNILLPLLARFLSPNPDAYTYLGDSIMNFPSPEAFKATMAQAGLVNVKVYRLTLGITCLYVGKRPAD